MKAITEEMDEQKKWYAEARGMKLDKLPAFLKRLTKDYQHDYGTICHAIAAAAIAAAWAVEHEPCGGITGFQAGAVGWQFIEEWGSPSFDKDLGARFTDMGNLLYPQYAGRFNSITPSTWARAQEKAKKSIADQAHAHPNVIAHWQSIVDGVVPFGLTVEESA